MFYTWAHFPDLPTAAANSRVACTTTWELADIFFGFSVFKDQF